MSFEEQCRELCERRFVEQEPGDGFLIDKRSQAVVAGPYDNLDIARDAARQLNDYVQRTTGTRPFYSYQPK